MGFILIISMVIRSVSMAASLILFRKIGGRQLAFLSFMLAALFIKQAFTLFEIVNAGDYQGLIEFLTMNIPGVVSIELYGLGVSFLFIIFLGPMLIEQERAQKAVEQSQRALLKSEARTEALLNAIPDLMLQISQEGIILAVKSPPNFSLSITIEAIGHPLQEFLPQDVVEKILFYIMKALRETGLEIFEYHLANHKKYYEFRLVKNGDREVLTIVRDITDRKRLERELLEISNREQRRIGQDLHDGLCQHLSGVAFMSEALQKKLAKTNPGEAETAASITCLLNDATRQTRNLSRGLYPVILEKQGLETALGELAANTQQMFRITCKLNIIRKNEESKEMQAILDNNTIAIHLYRIAQEAITNAVRHGKAANVSLKLVLHDRQINLSIEDDGQGFCDRGNGMGLDIMNYRAQMIGASLKIHSIPDKGTIISCYL